MKYLLIAIAFISLKAGAQNYADSNITLTLTRRAAWYVGHHIKQQSVWSDRLAPSALKNYVGTNTKPDSVFSVILKASYIKGMIDLLIGGTNEVTQADRLKIIDNSPATVGYTSLATQIVTKASGNTSEKQVAIYIRDYYLERLAAYSALREENINAVIEWSNN